MIAECLQCASTVSQQIPALGSSLYATAPGYLDPGTGSLIIQVIIGFLVGGLVAAKVLWKRIAVFFRARFRRSAPDDGADK